MVSGRDGTTLWSPPSLGMFGAIFLGVQGDHVLFGSPDDQWVVVTVNGASGKVLSTDYHDLPKFTPGNDTVWLMTSALIADMDGDGLADLFYSQRAENESGESTGGQLTAVSALGHVFASIEGVDDHALGPDLTGDGLRDLVRFDADAQSLTFIDLATVTDLWATDLPVVGILDHDREGASGLVMVTDTPGIDLVKGADGSRIWSAQG